MFERRSLRWPITLGVVMIVVVVLLIVVVALLASFQKVHWETSTGCFSTHPFRECMTDAIQHDDNGFRRFGNGPDEIPVLPSGPMFHTTCPPGRSLAEAFC